MIMFSYKLNLIMQDDTPQQLYFIDKIKNINPNLKMKIKRIR